MVERLFVVNWFLIIGLIVVMSFILENVDYSVSMIDMIKKYHFYCELSKFWFGNINNLIIRTVLEYFYKSLK